jgi:uncharacterized protein (TIGR00251 family)
VTATVATGLPFSAARDGVRLALRVVPKSSADRIVGLVADADGGAALKVAVHAAPEDGKANEAVLCLLAERLGLKRRDLTLALGAADRRKVVHIGGDPVRLDAILREALAPWLRG